MVKHFMSHYHMYPVHVAGSIVFSLSRLKYTISNSEEEYISEKLVPSLCQCLG